MYSQDVLCIVVFLDVNGQKLLLSETLVAGDAGEGFLSSVGSDVNGQVALLGGRRENKPLSSSQGGFGIRPYSLCSFFFSPPQRCVHHEEKPQRRRSLHSTLLGWERGLAVYKAKSEPVPAVRLQSPHD